MKNQLSRRLFMTIPLVLEKVFMIFLTTSNKILLSILKYAPKKNVNLARYVYENTIQ